MWIGFCIATFVFYLLMGLDCLRWKRNRNCFLLVKLARVFASKCRHYNCSYSLDDSTTVWSEL